MSIVGVCLVSNSVWAGAMRQCTIQVRARTHHIVMRKVLLTSPSSGFNVVAHKRYVYADLIGKKYTQTPDILWLHLCYIYLFILYLPLSVA